MSDVLFKCPEHGGNVFYQFPLKDKGAGFLQISNSIVNNDKLSYQAKGLYLALVAKATITGWNMNRDWIIKQSGRNGEASFRRCLDELKYHGYVRIEKERVKGKFISRWYIYSYPLYDYPLVEKPHVDKPGVEEPHVENHQHKRNKTEEKHRDNNTEEVKKKRKTEGEKEKPKEKKKDSSYEESLQIEKVSDFPFSSSSDTDRKTDSFSPDELSKCESFEEKISILIRQKYKDLDSLKELEDYIRFQEKLNEQYPSIKTAMIYYQVLINRREELQRGL
jgi:hypothetical protein